MTTTTATTNEETKQRRREREKKHTKNLVKYIKRSILLECTALHKIALKQAKTSVHVDLFTRFVQPSVYNILTAMSHSSFVSIFPFFVTAAVAAAAVAAAAVAVAVAAVSVLFASV